MRELAYAICNPLLSLRLEHTAIGTGGVFRHERLVEQLGRKDHRLPAPQGYLEFETRASIDTQADLVINDDGDRVQG
jgi:hypothetical protein